MASNTVFILFHLSVLLVYLDFGNSQLSFIPNNKKVFFHEESKKCLSVTEDLKLTLAECNWEKEKAHISGVFTVVKSNRGGYIIKWKSGPPPKGIEGCLFDLIPSPVVEAEEEEKEEIDEETDAAAADFIKKRKGRVDEDKDNSNIILSSCDARDDELNWEFHQVEGKKFQLRKFAFKKCLSVRDSTKDQFYMKDCIEESDNEQIWHICDADSTDKECENF